jgi:hypothetical protein
MVLVKWHGYWQDDNTVQHEVTHLFYPWEWNQACCVMTSHTHFQYFISEDGHTFSVFDNVLCALTAYTWCSKCVDIIESFNTLYIFQYIWPYGIMLRYFNVYEPTGTFYLDGVVACQGFHGYPLEQYHTVRFEQSEWLNFDYFYWKGTTKVYSQTFAFSPAGREGVAAVASEHVEMPYPGGHRGGPGKDNLPK